MLVACLLTSALLAGAPETPPAVASALRDLQADGWRERSRAARELGGVDGRRHPEVVAALAVILRLDPRPQVRGEAAEALARVGPLAPGAHIALDEAGHLDPAGAVRRRASRALAARGLRCSADCPLCGPLPRGAAITGPVLRWPELDRPPAGPASPTALPAGEPRGLPPALPEPRG